MTPKLSRANHSCSVVLLICFGMLAMDFEHTFNDMCYDAGYDPTCYAKDDLKHQFHTIDIFIFIVVYVLVTRDANYMLLLNKVEHCSVCRKR